MKLTSWGRYPRIEAEGSHFETTEQLRRQVVRDGNLIAYGMGRSYGDSALNERVVFSRRFNKILHFDPENGLVACECGVSLQELISVFLPRGWFLSVTPGTRLISVGGAIASDVHGKNHHVAGCFSSCVDSFELMLPGGEIVLCSREENSRLFRATCGGMGLTGVILTAVIRLQKVKSAYIRETVKRCRNLEEIFHCFEQYQKLPYSVAWIDCLESGDQVGRSVLMAGDHADTGSLDIDLHQPVSVPFDFPGFCLNRYSVKLFNRFYYHTRPASVEKRLVPLDPFFYPLDSIGHWNRIYGKGGFTQYQLVLPKSASYEGLKLILNRIAKQGLGSFLAVLKLCGPENGNDLSFPMEGYSLALDLKIEKKLFPFLDELDRMVIDYGGRLYLTKDVRMSKAVFRKGYPQWETFAELRETMGMKEKFTSLQSRRLEV
ncbi:MAG: FAD-binding oxidoreductase [Desulfobacteraceae bacterium]|nr:MAG: FAD-binding oxidoreductase [Desulfobacteraceae bacterium]